MSANFAEPASDDRALLETDAALTTNEHAADSARSVLLETGGAQDRPAPSPGTPTSMQSLTSVREHLQHVKDNSPGLDSPVSHMAPATPNRQHLPLTRST